MEADRIFSQVDVNKIFSHIPRATLRTWALQGLYSWVSENCDKRGRGRNYSISNLYQVGIVENLSKLDISTEIIKQIMVELGADPPMKKTIFITKKPCASRVLQVIASSPMRLEELTKNFRQEIYKRHHKAFFDWSYLVVDSEQVIFLLSEHQKSMIAITIIINLAAIKNFINQIILIGE